MKNPIPTCADLERSMALPSPPALPPDAPDSRLPAWILLDREAHIDYGGGRQNATTAEARARSVAQSVRVTFFAFDPPLLSHFCVHCPGLTRASDFDGTPSILYAVDDLALIRITFACGFRSEYFFYRAARWQRPSLQYLQNIGSYLSKVLVASIGVLPQRGGGFVLAALAFTLPSGQCEIHVFRSEQATWTSKALPYGNYTVANIEKVLDLGGGQLGFVDLRKGILVCDVLQEDPSARFIMFPKFLPNNQSRDRLCPGRWFRDAAVCSDGVIKCVEVETCLRLIPRKRFHASRSLPDDVSSVDVLHDTQMMQDCTATRQEEDTEEEDETYEYVGWRVIIWSRAPSSGCWRKEAVMNVDEIDVSNFPLLDAIGGSTLKGLFMLFPTLMDGALYLVSKVDLADQEIRVLMVDLDNKTVREISPILTQRSNFFLKPTYYPCSLPSYMTDDASWLATSTAATPMLQPARYYNSPTVPHSSSQQHLVRPPKCLPPLPRGWTLVGKQDGTLVGEQEASSNTPTTKEISWQWVPPGDYITSMHKLFAPNNQIISNTAVFHV